MILHVQPGTIVAERFRVENLAASGGMAEVYRARDELTGKPVALKLLTKKRGHHGRFARETAILAELAHPAIVAFVAQGATLDGTPFLAMEWVEGPTLEDRLDEGPLAPGETALLGSRLAEALSSVHRYGVIHRDLKPSNIALEGGAVERGKLLDFGVARWLEEGTPVTATGQLVGTPAYMSPEQCRGVALGPATDVFSLGVVLYQCLSGVSPFAAPRPDATMAKILFEPVPPLHQVGASVPAELEELIGRMLAKSPGDRPSDVEVIDGLAAHARADAGARPVPPSLGTRRLVSVVMARGVDPATTDTLVEGLPTLVTLEQLDTTLYGAAVEILRDRTLVATLRSDGDARQLCVRAARLALRIGRIMPEALVAVATGRSSARGKRPTDVFEAAGRLLESRQEGGAVLVDDVTRGFLEDRFAVRDGVLVGEEVDAGLHALHGRVLPCVGREGELAALEAAVLQCAEDSAARAYLLTAPPGVGKSRLVAELVRRLRERGQGFELCLGAGDPMTAGSPYAILARLGPDPAPQPWTKLAHGAVAEHVAQAWCDWLATRCRRGPVLLVLDDLHWGDLPSVKTIERALRQLRDRPLFVLALARPEIHEIFPRLWSRAAPSELRLPELPPRAAERLAAEALGPAAESGAVAQIAGASAGNPFFLEELVRAHLAGSSKLPESILATVQARLDQLDDAPRRVLCAASVLGQTVLPEDVAALVPDLSPAALLAHFEELVALELLEPQGRKSYTFRHALIHESVYASLPDGDRRRAHRVAGEKLARASDADALTVAQHFERGGDLDRASGWWARAAEAALHAGDFEAAAQRARRGAAHGVAEGPTLARLFLLEAEAHLWRMEDDAGRALAERALALAPPGDPAWFRGMRALLIVCGRAGNYAEAAAIVAELIERPVEEIGAREHAHALITGLFEVAVSGIVDLPDEGLARLEDLFALIPASDRELFATRRQLDACIAVLEDDPGAALGAFDEAIAAFHDMGDDASVRSNQRNRAFIRCELGDYARAEADLREVLEAQERVATTDAFTLQNLGLVLTKRGRLDEAQGFLERSVALSAQAGQRRIEAISKIYLSQLHAVRGEAAEAEALAARAVELAAEMPAIQSFALAQVASSQLEQGRVAEALAASAAAMSLRSTQKGLEGGLAQRLARAEALAAAGQLAEAREVALEGREWILGRAEGLEDERLRRAFLETPENARLLALASRLA